MSALGYFTTGAHGRLEQVKVSSDAHLVLTGSSAHGAVATATPSQIITRDASGRANVSNPVAADNSTLIATTAWVQNELGVGGFGTVTNIASGTGLTGGPITTTGTLSLANTAVSPGSYTLANITVDQQGRITSATDGTAAVTDVTGTSPIVSSGGATPAISIPAATGSVNGYMSSTDKTKLDNATQSGTNNALMIRSVTGKAEVTDPTAGEDIMNYQYWQANRVTDVSDLTGITISTSPPSGGADGDIWLQY